MAKPKLERLFELQKFLHEFHFIERVVHLPGKKDRAETDTEHSYTLAMTAWFLAQYFPELDTNKCIRLALIHDLVEIYAGDTFAYDKKRLESKTERERQAVQRISKEWSDFTEMTEAINEYESLKTPESCFVFALDKMMPPIIVFMGEGYTWKKHKITYEMQYQRKITDVRKSKQANHYYQELDKLMKQNLDYFYKS